MTRDSILESVWGYDYSGDTRTVDTLVKQLRRKIAPYGSYIRSVYGVGYIFEGEEMKQQKLRASMLLMELMFLLIVVGGSVLLYNMFAPAYYRHQKSRVIEKSIRRSKTHGSVRDRR